VQFLADYGKLGHGEVVGMKIPEASIGDFAKEYFSLFSPTNDRVDPGDVGPEYRYVSSLSAPSMIRNGVSFFHVPTLSRRSLLGLPGGVRHPSYPLLEEAAASRGLKLVEGKGNDPDTLRKKIVYVMDSNRFPFYQAEAYHQFHNDFQSPPYGKQYNSLAKLAFADGRIKETGCPDRLPL
jgi:peptide methionine sulfoxide reductase MsrA